MKKVVILLSDKRSGSTMFQRELCKHPDVQTVRYSSHTYLETHHWTKAAVMLDLPAEKFSGGKVYWGYGSKKNARAYMEDTILGNCPDFQVPVDDRELVFRGWDALCEKYAQPVFFEKSPQLLANWGALELLLEWMQHSSYDVKLVGLVRNPMSVQFSAFELFHTNPQKRQYGWMEIQNNLLKMKEAISQDQFKIWRYEDLVLTPKESFESLCSFLGITYDANVGATSHASSLTKWRDDPFFQLELAPEVKQTALALGYTSDELFNPEKPNPPLLLRVRRSCRGWYVKSRSALWNKWIRPLKMKYNQKK